MSMEAKPFEWIKKLTRIS